ncbi:MAG: glycosyltransferase family 4 protein [Synergistota bacterium]|nr:glycosyltransferase family 4 protein [Synergistota bacterium]
MIKVKILHYVDENHLAWGETWIQLIKEFSRKKIQNHVICKSGGTLAERLKEENLPHETFDIPVSWLPQTGTKLRKIIADFSPDVIHTRLSSAARIAGYWGKRAGIPVVQTVDKFPKAHYHKDADFLLTCSESVRSHMEGLGFPASKITTIFNPVDSKLYSFNSNESENTRNRLGILPDEKIILGAGRFVDWKGFDNLIKAYKLLSDNSQQNVKLLLLGDGEEKNKLCGLIRSLGIEKKVIMPGFVQDIRPYLWASDIFVLPSKEPEPFGIVLIEAMASGLASVATKAGGPIDIIEDGINGCLVEVDSCKDIADKLKILLEDENYRVRIAKTGMDRVAYKFSVEEIANRHIEIYSKFIKIS